MAFNRSRIYTQPTYTINQSSGWKTRLLYSYWSSADNLTDNTNYIVDGKVDYTNIDKDYGNNLADTDIFETISYCQNLQFEDVRSYMVKSLTPLDSSAAIATNRLLSFPADYWKTGKSVRIKGALHLPGAADTNIFNMRLSIRDIAAVTTTVLAKQNNGTNHTITIPGGTPLSEGPYVNFEFIYSSVIGTVTQIDNKNQIFMKAEGYYQYDNNLDTGGNDQTRFVPVYYNVPYYEALNDSNQAMSPTRIMIDFDGSTVSSILLRYVTVEELQ